jgi:hypothetical protein
MDLTPSSQYYQIEFGTCKITNNLGVELYAPMSLTAGGDNECLNFDSTMSNKWFDIVWTDTELTITKTDDNTRFMQANISGGIVFNFLKIASKWHVIWDLKSTPEVSVVTLSNNPTWVTKHADGVSVEYFPP